MIKLELDWMYKGYEAPGKKYEGDPDTVEEFKPILAAWAAEAGVKAEVEVEVGPAGGWPVVGIEGDEKAVRAFILQRYLNGVEKGPNGLEGLLEDLDLVGQL